MLPSIVLVVRQKQIYPIWFGDKMCNSCFNVVISNVVVTYTFSHITAQFKLSLVSKLIKDLQLTKVGNIGTLINAETIIEVIDVIPK